MVWVWLVIAVLLGAPSAVAQCPPSGRSAFAAGLEALGRGDLPAAAARFDAIVKAQPDCAEARNNLAVVFVEQGRIDEAAYQLRRALRVRPDYYRARLNLERVEALLAAQQREASGEDSLGPAAARSPATAPPGQAVPSTIAALEPLGATACVVEPGQGRVCLYRRAPRAIVGEECYPTASVDVRGQPHWMMVSDVRRERIRLVDELGHERLKVIPDTASVTGDAVQLREADFDSLAGKVVPWRTVCVVWERPAGEAAPIANGALAMAVRDAIEAWRRAREQKQLDAYLGQYSRTFVPQSEPEVGSWRERERYLFEHAGTISVEVGAPSIFVFDQDDTAITSFEQWYRSGTRVSHTLKALRWQREGDRWTISAETVLKEYP